VRLEGQNLEVAVPDAAVSVGKAGKLSIRGGRLTSSNAMVPTAIGELTFRAQGTAGAALAYLDQEALSAERPLGLSSDAVDGKAEAQFKIAVPLGERLGAKTCAWKGRGGSPKDAPAVCWAATTCTAQRSPSRSRNARSM
jgi:hypothetical protein